jgi:hypothetical protein
MGRFFSTFFLLIWATSLGASVIGSLDKAKKLAKLYEKPIICFFDNSMDEEGRLALAKEYFNDKLMYNSFSHTHLFTHSKSGEHGISGFMIISSEGEVVSTINTYKDMASLVSDISAPSTF